MPPSCAMAMARRDSVTVSMAADTSGMFRGDVARQARGQGSVARQDLGIRRHQQHIVEGERFCTRRMGNSGRKSKIIRRAGFFLGVDPRKFLGFANQALSGRKSAISLPVTHRARRCCDHFCPADHNSPVWRDGRTTSSTPGLCAQAANPHAEFYWGHLIALKQSEPPAGQPHGKYTCELVLPSAARSWHVSVAAHNRMLSQPHGDSGPENKSEIASAISAALRRATPPPSVGEAS